MFIPKRRAANTETTASIPTKLNGKDYHVHIMGSVPGAKSAIYDCLILTAKYNINPHQQVLFVFHKSQFVLTNDVASVYRNQL